uniref:Aldehyde dehydrogenase domain-containing protein n=1 Tax=Rhodosorus marinus TaxID=101924 RepID=A0A7S3EKF2_9RHOD|mmetsp:Transcript_40638/g.161152  ORF Transcript_40638/g.161152 Transcript_40638/m.161152 type:complete len:967 (+) Transcript_40638:115-3015(+)
MAANVRASDSFVESLENEGVEFVFGLPGEENLDVLDSLRKSKKIKLVVCKHEQAAGFMAATIGRITGKIGVCLSTLGPGATNFTTCAAYSQLGGYPMMMITGQKPIRASKQGSFQIVDVVQMMTPLCKFTKQVSEGELLLSLVRRSTKIAESEKPGPVHLEIPEDIAGESVPYHPPFPVFPVRRAIAEMKAIDAAVKMIVEARSPLLCIAAGANRARTARALRQFVDALEIPFITTQQGKGVIDERHPLFIGTAAISANDYVHCASDEADLIINCGHDTVEKPPFFMHRSGKTKVLHINFYPSEVDEVYFPHGDVVGDIANAIWQIKETIKERQPHWDFRWFMTVKEFADKHVADHWEDTRYPFTPQRVIAAIRQAMPEDGVVCLDNGMYKVWFARMYKTYGQNTLLLDNALATMGAGLPSAMAVKLKYPDRKVFGVCGDGGFAMNSQEIATAVEHGIDLTCIVLNDNAYGMIEWKQHTGGFQKWGLGIVNPDFVALAESFGAHGHRVNSSEELEPTLEKVVNLKGVHIVEIPVDYTLSTEILGPVLAERVKELLSLKPQIPVAREPVPVPTPMDKEPEPKPAEPAPGVVPAPVPVKVEAAPKGSTGPLKYPYYIANVPVFANEDLQVIDKATGEVHAVCAQADEAVVDKAIAAADAASKQMAAMPSYKRKAVLERAVVEMKERFEELALALCAEAGKPIKDARGEVGRLIDTFTIAAEESVRIYGEYAPLDISARVEGFSSIVRRFPIGAVSMVSPFNFPLNLAAHKIAPALAVGCPFVMKPASRTPIGALIIGDILSKAPELPAGAFSILPCTRASADLFTVDPRFKMLSFTGSPDVGWKMKERAGKKKVTLELGGNAACVIDEVVPDIDAVVKSVIHGAFYQSGQSCISVQRIFVNASIYGQVRDAIVAAADKLRMGDPRDEATFIGPMIDVKEADRVERWVEEAKAAGGKVFQHKSYGGLRA